MISAFMLFQNFLAKTYEMSNNNPKMALFMAFICTLWAFGKLKTKLKSPKPLQNKVILITGGVSGIGRLTALMCKLKGAKVIVWDLNEKGLQEMSELVDLSMKCDVTNQSLVASNAQKVLKQFGKVDILINNAGIVSGKKFLDLSPKQIELGFKVNVISHFWTIQAFLPSMIERKSGHIVTIASMSSLGGIPYLTDYCANKHACKGLHDALTVELKESGMNKGISTSCIMPYFINTGMFDGTNPSQNWIMKKLLSMDFLDPQYVASEIVRAIQYDIRDMTLPHHFYTITYLGHLLPYWLTDNIVIKQGCSLKNFIGRAHGNSKK